MSSKITSLFTDRRGATAVEYGLIACLVVLAAMTAIIGLADTTTDLWDRVSSTVQDASK